MGLAFLGEKGGSLTEGQGVLGAQTHWGLPAKTFVPFTPRSGKVHGPSSHVGKTGFERVSVPKEKALETPRTLFGTSQMAFYRCQRPLHISHVQPEVFIQGPNNHFGFDQKPQLGVNISPATFYDIYTLRGSPGLMITKCSVGKGR